MSALSAHLATITWPLRATPMDFVAAVWRWIITHGRTLIDTPEERDAIIRAAMEYYDQTLVPQFPWLAQWRLLVVTTLQMALLYLATPPQGE